MFSCHSHLSHGLKTLVALSALAVVPCGAEVKNLEVKGAPFELTIVEWTPPARRFPISDYGARPDGTPVTEAVDKAIAAAHAAGGGRVVVPKGEWLCGAFRLKSDVALVLEDDAVLHFPDDPVVVYRAPLRANGLPTPTCSGIIQADGCTNVAVMGRGTLTCDVDYWHRNFLVNPQRGFPRPQLLHFSNCDHVRLEGFKVRGSPAWTLHLKVCSDIVLRDVDSVCTGPNTDGLDLESCNRALVEGCSLDQTDDTYTIKSGFNEAGRKRNIPTQNVVIRNCRAVHGHSLLGIGSEVSGGIRNIYMADCTVESECWNWLFVKTNAKRGAFVENVTLDNVRGRRANQAVMNVEMYYDGNPNKELGKKGETLWCTAISNVVCRGVVCEEAGCAVRVRGDEHLPPKALRAENVRVGRLRAGGGLVKATNAPELVTKDVRLDPPAVREILDLPPQVRACEVERDADPSVVFTRQELEEISDNAARTRVLEARIAAEVATGRTCAPKVTPVDFEAMGETLEGGHTKRFGEMLADLGCALPGAWIADDVRKVVRLDARQGEGALTTSGGVRLGIEPDERQGRVRIRLTNGGKSELRDLWCVVHLPLQFMTHRQACRVARVAAGETFERMFEFGAGAHYLPRPVGENVYAAEVDFTQGNERVRVWATKSVPVKEPFALPYKTALCIGSTDRMNVDEQTLLKLSGETGALPVLGEGSDAKWRSPEFPGAAWYDVTGPSRPYTKREQNLVRSGRAMEAVALQFEASERAKVKARFLPWLWDREMSVYLNGQRVPVASKVVDLPTKPGVNRMIVRFRSKPGERKACAQLAVYTWSVTDHVTCLPLVAENCPRKTVVAGPVKFPLEWNTTYVADVPYEVEISRGKLAAHVGAAKDTGFRVAAKTASGDVEVPATILPGRTEESVFLRFTPPKGTTALFCEATGTGTVRDPNAADNLFAGALDDLARWQPTPRMGLEKDAEGLVLFAREGGSPEAVTFAEVTPEIAGRDVRFETTLENLTDESWTVLVRLIQLDEKGNRLPELVSDCRWTSLMQPAHGVCPLSERGHVHPAAKKLKFYVSLRSIGKAFDRYGRRNAHPEAFKARFRLRRLAVRVAERLPFPKYDEGNFAPGVSGRPGDFALALGGPDGKAFWYQTRSMASWAEGVPMREETQLFYPLGAGTVEAWFKSAWTPVKVEGQCRAHPLFQHYQGYRQHDCQRGLGEMMLLAYRPEPGELVFRIKDHTGRAYEGQTPAKLPANVWCHLAVQWAPGGVAEVFVDGRRVLAVPIPEWKALDLSNKEAFPRPNDEGGHELFVGSNFNGTRWTLDSDPYWPYVQGWVDQLRVSTGRRYAGDFTPAKEFACDRDTRALFGFDRSFDGCSGGGLGFVRGSTRGIGTGRVARTLQVGETTVDYWPKDITPENDPHVVFDVVNFPKLPTPADFEAARRPFSRTATLKAGETLDFECPERTVTDYVEIANEGTKPLVWPILVNEGEVDPRSAGDLADTLGLEGLSPRDRVNRVFAFVLSASDYFMNHTAMFPPGSDRPRDVEYQAMLMLNGYCGFECGPLNNMAANLFVNVAGCPAAQTAGYGHSFEEVFFDGKNHVYDLSAQKFFPAMDNESAAYLEEGGDETGVFARMGNECEHYIRRCHRGHWVQTPDCVAKVGVTLDPGERFRVWWVNDGHCNDLIQRTKSGPYRGYASKFRPDYTEPCHADTEKVFLQRAERFFPQYLNGFLMFSGVPSASNPAFVRVEPDAFCYDVDAGGYPIVHAEYAATKKDGSRAEIELSTDGGKSFRPLVSPADYAVRARYAYLVRVKAPIGEIARFEASTEVQLNPRIYPGRIKAGRNSFRLKMESGGAAKVTVAGRVPQSRISIPAAAASGTIVGAETLFYAFDPKDCPELEVKGLGANASVRTCGAVGATLANGRLKLSGDAKDGVHFAGVTLVSDGAEKELTVLIGPGVRFAVAKDAKVADGAKVLPPDETSPQARVRFGADNHAASAVFGFDPIPAGKYSVLELNRFRSHPEKGASDRLRIIWPGQKSTALGQPRNWSCNFKKANYGRPGERANFKWDYANHPGTAHPYANLKVAEYPAADHLEVRSWRDDVVEVVALLVVPECSADLRGELVKFLCGLNSNPWRMSDR